MMRQSHTNIHPARESKGMADKTKTQTKLNGWAAPPAGCEHSLLALLPRRAPRQN